MRVYLLIPGGLNKQEVRPTIDDGYDDVLQLPSRDGARGHTSEGEYFLMLLLAYRVVSAAFDDDDQKTLTIYARGPHRSRAAPNRRGKVHPCKIGGPVVEVSVQILSISLQVPELCQNEGLQPMAANAWRAWIEVSGVQSLCFPVVRWRVNVHDVLLGGRTLGSPLGIALLWLHRAPGLIGDLRRVVVIDV